MNELDKIARYQYAVLLNRAGRFELSTTLLMGFATTDSVTPLVQQAAGIAALRLPVLPEEVPPDQAEAVQLAGQASILAWQKRTADGTKAAETLLAKYPDLPNAHYLMGYLLLLQNDGRCLEEFRKVVELAPNHVPARLQIAYEYFRRSELDRALGWAEQAVKLAPRDFIAHNIYGRILLGLDRIPEATRELEAAVRLEPASAEAHFHLASAYNRAGRREEAAQQREIFAKLGKERKN
jgi:tetratricopeptide (TPR) repeat protein